jgi:hypothetical protein
MGEKNAVSAAFFLPFSASFGMVLHLSLGAPFLLPGAVPKHKKTGFPAALFRPGIGVLSAAGHGRDYENQC